MNGRIFLFVRQSFLLDLALSLVFFAGGCESRKVGAVSAGPLVLQLVEKNTETPCPGVLAEVISAGHLLSSGTSGEGGLLELPHSFPGRVLVRLQDPRERYVHEEIELGSGGKQRIELMPDVMTRLKVLDASGTPCQRVEITAWPRSGAGVCRFTLDSEGSFGPLPPGGVKVLVASPLHKTAVLDLNLKPRRKGKRGEDLGEVRLSRGGSSLRGKVIARTERFPKEALLRFDGVGQLTEVNAGGNFEFSGLSTPEPGKKRGKAMLVLRRGQKELYARDLELGFSDVDLGAIELEN